MNMNSTRFSHYLNTMNNLSPSKINEFLTNHLNEHNLTYYEHLKRSLCFYKELEIGAAKALIHAFAPFLFETSTTDLVNKLKEELEQELEEEPESEIEQKTEEESETQANNNKKDE